jgi:hypothetical protein
MFRYTVEVVVGVVVVPLLVLGRRSAPRYAMTIAWSVVVVVLLLLMVPLLPQFF